MSRPRRPSDHRRYFRVYEDEAHAIADRELLGVLVALYAELNARKAHLDDGAILLHPTARMSITGKRTVAAADRLMRRALAELAATSDRDRAELAPSFDVLAGGEWRVYVRKWQQKQGYPPTQRQQDADAAPPPVPIPVPTERRERAGPTQREPPGLISSCHVFKTAEEAVAHKAVRNLLSARDPNWDRSERRTWWADLFTAFIEGQARDHKALTLGELEKFFEGARPFGLNVVEEAAGYYMREHRGKPPSYCFGVIQKWRGPKKTKGNGSPNITGEGPAYTVHPRCPCCDALMPGGRCDRCRSGAHEACAERLNPGAAAEPVEASP